MLDQSPTPPFPHRLSGDSAYDLARGTWSPEAVRSSRIELPGALQAAGQARRAIAGFLAGLVEDRRLQDLCLMATEVVTNAVLHGEGSSGVVMYLAASAR